MWLRMIWWAGAGILEMGAPCRHLIARTLWQPCGNGSITGRAVPASERAGALSGVSGRAIFVAARSGGTGRRAGLKIQWYLVPCGFDPLLRDQISLELSEKVADS